MDVHNSGSAFHLAMASETVSPLAHMLTRSTMVQCIENESSSENESTTVCSDVQTSQQGDYDSANERIAMTQADTVQPSVGSAMHDSGECKPCAFVWKPQGCQNGRDCFHCHMCPPGTIKSRRKLKFAQVREAVKAQQSSEDVGLSSKSTISPPPGLPLFDDCCSPTSSTNGEELLTTSQKAFFSKPATEDAMPSESKGSRLHGTGGCRPCAWFWHAKGCQNGADCEYCHLCSKGELKLKKKLKISLLRSALKPESFPIGKDSMNSSLCPEKEKKQTGKKKQLTQGKEMSAVSRQLATQNQLILMQQQQLSQLQMQLQIQQHVMMASITPLGRPVP